jgi:hypothetical protein
MEVMESPRRAVDAVVAANLANAALDLARRFAAGATMWCVAAQWPAHGRHVAVEFVHPVIVGKRALPAVSIEGPDRVDTLRLLARPGDVLLAVSSSQDVTTRDLLARSQTWGLERIWLGAGPQPQSAMAEHVIWLAEGDASRAARSGEVVLLYHLLWELTHVVFEHPGLLIPEAPCAEEVCITCSDEGLIGEVRSLLGENIVEALVGGKLETVDASLVHPVIPGDLILVHAGVALTNIDLHAEAQLRGVSS